FRNVPARRFLSRTLSAIATALSAHGFLNGVTAMSDSSSQRMLSLWLRRLSTDRIARLRKNSPPLRNARGGERALVVAGKRGNAEVLIAIDDAAERLGLARGRALAHARRVHS